METKEIELFQGATYIIKGSMNSSYKGTEKVQIMELTKTSVVINFGNYISVGTK